MSQEELARVFEQMSALNVQQGQMNVTLAKLTVTVEEHVKRCNLLEARQDKLDGRLQPLIQRDAMVAGAMRLLAGVAAVVGVVYELGKLSGAIH